MAEFTRQTPDIGFSNFINPGVQDNSTAAMIGAVGGGALALDAEMQRKKFAAELEDLKASRVSAAPQVVALQEQAAASANTEAPQQSPQDVAYKNTVASQIKAREAAVSQGRMSHNDFLLEAERLLRQAQARRPGLAAEFRQMAADYFGEDVSSAGLQILNQQEQDYYAALENAAKEKATAADKEYTALWDTAKKYNLETDFLSLGPDTNTRMRMFWSPEFQAQVRAAQKAEFEAGVLENNAKAQQAGFKLNAAQNTADWNARADVEITNVYPVMRDAIASIRQLPPEQQADGLRQMWLQGENGQPGFLRQIEQVRDQLVADADLKGISPELRQLKVDKFNFLIETFNKFTDPAMDAKQIQGNIDALLTTLTMDTLQDDGKMRSIAVLEKLFPGLPTRMISDDPSFKATVLNSAAKVVENTASPSEVMATAGSFVRPFFRSIVEASPSGKALPEEQQKEVSDMFTRMFDAFSTAPWTQFKPSEFAGNNTGLLSAFKRREYAVALANRIGPERARQVAESAARATFKHLRAASLQAQQGLNQAEQAEWKANVTASTPGKDGSIFTAKGPVSPRVQMAISHVNETVQSPYIWNMIGGLTGQTDRAEMLKFVNVMGNPNNAPKTPSQPAGQQPKPTKPSTQAPASVPKDILDLVNKYGGG